MASRSPSRYLARMAERPKRYALAIELTTYCNQKCGYCYNGWRDDGGKSVGALPTLELCALVDRALTEIDFDHVTLTGGEPFARVYLFDVFDVIKKHGKRAQMISNGGVVTDALAERLRTYRPLYVQVTLNGPTEALHAEHVGEGHWDKTLRGIATLLSLRFACWGSTWTMKREAPQSRPAVNAICFHRLWH